MQLPPYRDPTTSNSGQTLFVQCRVCQHVIHVGSGSQTRVVKCGHCREATVSDNEAMSYQFSEH